MIQGFAFEPQDLARVSTPEVLDQIIENSLALRLGDETFAAEVYDDIRDQAVRASEQWHDARISIGLSMDKSASRERSALRRYGPVGVQRHPEDPIAALRVR